MKLNNLNSIGDSMAPDPSRRPPSEVRHELRSEVGFGCPLCGSPHLEYHHFDPPWSIVKHHNAKGMIALCARHHDEADAGAFTKEQLVQLKDIASVEVKSEFQWRRKHTVFVCGGNYAYQCGAMLQVRGINIIYFQKDQNGFDTLSLNIYDVCLNPIFVMRMNDWIARSDVDDIEAPPRSPKLIFKSSRHRVDLEISFKDRSRMDIHEKAIAIDFGIPEADNVVFVYFNGKMPAPIPIEFGKDAILMKGLEMKGNRMRNCGVGIVIN